MPEVNPNEFPAHPLLDISELAEVRDLRAQVPYLQPYLQPGEMVVQIDEIERTVPDRQPSALQAMARLAGVQRPADIGTGGPSLASISFEANAQVAELSKFEHLFGRDSLMTALLLKDAYPQLLKTNVLANAAVHGVRDDPVTGEQPGGIAHDNMDPADPVAQKFAHYYGWRFPMYTTVDATPLFIDAFCTAESQDDGLLHEMYVDKTGQERPARYALDAAVAWLERRLDDNPEGLLEYHKTQAKGMDNHAWKDSFHAYVHEDGLPANHEAGIASIEVQGYAYDALVRAAVHYAIHGHSGRADELLMRAYQLRQRVLHDFWVEDEHGGFFALATDRDEHGNLRPLRVRSSNMGHLLRSKLLDGDDPAIVHKRETVIRQLFTPEMLAAGGIRTLASDEVGFNPYSYHNGGVWGHDTGWIAAGLEKHGYYGLAWELNKCNLASVEATRSFPELVQGGDEAEPRVSERWVSAWNPDSGLLYPLERTPQEIQAWMVAAVLAAKYKWPLPAGFPRRTATMPLTAVDPAKRQFEESILETLH